MTRKKLNITNLLQLPGDFNMPRIKNERGKNGAVKADGETYNRYPFKKLLTLHE